MIKRKIIGILLIMLGLLLFILNVIHYKENMFILLSLGLTWMFAGFYVYPSKRKMSRKNRNIIALVEVMIVIIIIILLLIGVLALML